MNRIYMDHAATTPVDPRVLEAMLPYFQKKFGNASSAHSYGREAALALEDSRERIEKSVNAKAGEIIFTSGGTESDNLAIKGAAYKTEKKHIITSAIEHNAVLNPCRFLEKQGFKVTCLGVDEYGRVDPAAVEDAITKETFLISIMHANNEVGTIQEVGEIGRMAREHDVLFHTDAVQTAGKIPIDVEKMDIDLLSISSHKIYGPKGVGALYVRGDTELEPVLHGGGHEGGLRAGTENISGVVGFAKAMDLCLEEMDSEMKRLSGMRDRLIKSVLEIPQSRLNGHPTKRLPNNAHFTFLGMTGCSLVSRLDESGISASASSACFAHATEPPHVLSALGRSVSEANSSLRLSLGRNNTLEEIDHVAETLRRIFQKVRCTT